jgi:copper resistance protein B
MRTLCLPNRHTITRGMAAHKRESRLARGIAGAVVLAGIAMRVSAQPALPPITDADRAAAFPDLGGHSHAMLEDPFDYSLRVDELEARNLEGDDVLAWKAHAWIGRSFDKLAIRTEGEQRSGDTERAELQLLWSHTITRWWNLVTGARVDFRPAPSRTWGAFGVEGIAPYRFDIEATAFLADGGDSAARVEATYELRITQRWILEPRLEIEWYGQDEPALGLGSGLARSEGGLRLRYEIRREVAPYVGLVSERRYGGSEDLSRAAGDDPHDTRFVAGVRLRF